MTIYGTIGETAIVKEPVSTNQGIIGLWDPVETNVIFAKYALDFEKDRLASKKRETTQANIGKNILKLHEIPYPSLAEQRSIASVLYNVDQAILKTEEIIEQTRRVKKGIMQNLFTEGYYDHEKFEEVYVGPKRVKIPNSWTIEQLGDLSELITKGKTPTSYGFDYKDEGINFVKAKSIEENEGFLPEKFASISYDADEKLSSSRLQKDDILFSIAGALGKTARVKKEILPANINQALALIRLSQAVNPSYVTYFLSNSIIQKYIKSIATTTAQSNLNLTQVSEFQIILPSKKEQQKIVNTLENLDKRLSAFRKEKKKLQRLKKGLMQDLLTGMVRTKGKDIQVLGEV